MHLYKYIITNINAGKWNAHCPLLWQRKKNTWHFNPLTVRVSKYPHLHQDNNPSTWIHNTPISEQLLHDKMQLHMCRCQIRIDYMQCKCHLPKKTHWYPWQLWKCSCHNTVQMSIHYETTAAATMQYITWHSYPLHDNYKRADVTIQYKKAH